jgi:ribonuclease P protein component
LEFTTDYSSADFPKKLRLLRNADFKAVFEHKCRASSKLLTVHAAPNNLDFSRISISLSKSMGCAAARNRFKRLVREFFSAEQSCYSSVF